MDNKPFRFIDTVCAINDHLKIDKNYNDIYPLELELKKKVYQRLELGIQKESISTSKASFLDL